MRQLFYLCKIVKHYTNFSTDGERQDCSRILG